DSLVELVPREVKSRYLARDQILVAINEILPFLLASRGKRRRCSLAWRARLRRRNEMKLVRNVRSTCTEKAEPLLLFGFAFSERVRASVGLNLYVCVTLFSLEVDLYFFDLKPSVTNGVGQFAGRFSRDDNRYTKSVAEGEIAARCWVHKLLR
ncbi:MAG: hypothetical protein ACI9G1_005900, partial [Pirellulaceae bacterium]